MSKCIKCGTNFVGTPENPPLPGLCKYCEIKQLKQSLHDAYIALATIANYPLHSEPMGIATTMQEIAAVALKAFPKY